MAVAAVVHQGNAVGMVALAVMTVAKHQWSCEGHDDGSDVVAMIAVTESKWKWK